MSTTVQSVSSGGAARSASPGALDSGSRRRFLALLGAAASLPSMWSGPAHAARSLVMQAAWLNNAEFSGYFVARDRGWYAAEGLALRYLPGGPDVTPGNSLRSGRADLALASLDSIVRAIVDEGAALRVIGAQYQKNPLGIISMAANPVDTVGALAGKTLAVPPFDLDSVEAVLRLNDIERSAVNIVPFGDDASALMAGQIDATTGFVTNVPYLITLLGGQPVSLLLHDLGYALFNDVVVVTEETLASRRGDLVAWLRASRRGWEENFLNTSAWPPRWGSTWFAGTGRDIANEVYYNAAQKPLIETEDGIFSMSEEAIAANIDALGRVGVRATRAMFDTSLLDEI